MDLNNSMAFLIVEKVLDIITVVFDFVKDKQKSLRKQDVMIRIILQIFDFQKLKTEFLFTESLLGIFKLYNRFHMNFGVGKT
ncbi:hypothetical protein CHA01nite_15240 [Chryseobacterium hagamense]|uniref:Uncharacterized protein n=1 Tax=Chryseobacterium hagamense TaxID=395935 RepID=A0A511YKS6_9FLAO|nr:hypothetical protein CHA01nite_15240 [Chryseobacterium hagamense]